VKITWVERTLLDLGAHLPPRTTGLALDDALRERKTTLQRLWRELDLYGGSGKSGSKTLRDLLQLRDDRDGKLESQLEAAALAVLRDRRLPPVTPQFVVREAGSNPPRLDFAYPSCRIGIEAHSYRWHLDPDQMRKDAARDNRLKLLGWTVLHYTWDDLHFERQRVIAEIRQLLVRCGALLV
jgi:very-short-patch-repair endonuclease